MKEEISICKNCGKRIVRPVGTSEWHWRHSADGDFYYLYCSPNKGSLIAQSKADGLDYQFVRALKLLKPFARFRLETDEEIPFTNMVESCDFKIIKERADLKNRLAHENLPDWKVGTSNEVASFLLPYYLDGTLE